MGTATLTSAPAQLSGAFRFKAPNGLLERRLDTAIPPNLPDRRRHVVSARTASRAVCSQTSEVDESEIRLDRQKVKDILGHEKAGLKGLSNY
jgi:hypothetical protein